MKPFFKKHKQHLFNFNHQTEIDKLKNSKWIKNRINKTNIKKALFILPNILTISSIFCGLYAIWNGLTNNTLEALYESAAAVVLAGFFDLFDGRVARLTETQSEFGIQLDSLADVINFGVAPALLIYRWALEPLGLVGFIGIFFYVTCGAIRLARFNIVSNSSSKHETMKYFTGLPIPLAASVLIAVLIIDLKILKGSAEHCPVCIFVLMIVLGLLMVSTIQYWTFKNYKFNRSLFLFVPIILLSIFWAGLYHIINACIILFLVTYVLSGIVICLIKFIPLK